MKIYSRHTLQSKQPKGCFLSFSWSSDGVILQWNKSKILAKVGTESMPKYASRAWIYSKLYILNHFLKSEYYIHISIFLVDGIDMIAPKFRETECQTDLFQVCLPYYHTFCVITLNEQWCPSMVGKCLCTQHTTKRQAGTHHDIRYTQWNSFDLFDFMGYTGEKCDVILTNDWTGKDSKTGGHAKC